MDGRLAIHAFGDLVFTLDGQAAALESRRELGLAFYLAYTGQACSRSTLADLIWPESNPAQARTNLRRALSNLRHQLPGLLVINREHVHVDPDCSIWLDVHEFEACVSQLDLPAIGSLEKGVELYRGDFLAYFSIDSQPYQDWVSGGTGAAAAAGDRGPGRPGETLRSPGRLYCRTPATPAGCA